VTPVAIRLCKIALLASYSLLLALIAFGNITDYDSNWTFVQHTLSMDTTFQSPGVMWRAIDNPTLQTVGYLGIIATETLAALLCLAGTLRLMRARKLGAEEFERAKTLAVCGVTLSLVLWLAGFLAIGGEWFAMWQSSTWNGAESAGRFLLAGGIALIFLIQPDRELGR